MLGGETLRTIDDVEKERDYGYVHNISGSSMYINVFSWIKTLKKFLVITANHMFGSAINELV